MSDLKFSLLWALTGLFLALFAFAFNYNLHPVNLPGYELFAGPAMLAVMPFSEETPFWPKLGIFLFGQYLFYFITIFVVKKLLKNIFTKKPTAKNSTAGEIN